jgi:hypothetical protein
MKKDQLILKEALNLFHSNERGLYVTNYFVDAGSSLQVNSIFNEENNFKLERLFHQTWQDVWNISTLLERIEWLRELAIENAISDNKWRDYIRVDIEHFHTEIRSAMDYVAEIISIFSNRHGQLPTSFNRLKERIDKFDNKIQEDICLIIRNTDWFSDIRHVRDSLVHYGGNTLVFCRPNDGTLFQIYDSKLSNLINKKYILFNENVAIFDGYAALYYAQLLVFLNNLGKILIKNLPNRAGIGQSMSYSAGFYVAKEWIEKLQNLILKNSAC